MNISGANEFKMLPIWTKDERHVSTKGNILSTSSTSVTVGAGVVVEFSVQTQFVATQVSLVLLNKTSIL